MSCKVFCSYRDLGPFLPEGRQFHDLVTVRLADPILVLSCLASVMHFVAILMLSELM